MNRLVHSAPHRLAPEAEQVIAALQQHQILAEEADPDLFRHACHHRDDITAWFDQHPGWRVRTDRAAGVCRLYKRRPDPPAGRVPALQRAKASARTPVSPLVLVLTALICEQMWRAAHISFNHLQRALIQTCAAEAADGRLPRFQPVAHAGERRATASAHRMAFIDALRLLGSFHLLSFDRSLSTVEQDTEADLLITARRERLALLIACPAPSLLATDLDAPDSHVAALTPDQAPPPPDAPPAEHEQYHRHQALRAVLDDPGFPVGPDTGAGRYLASHTGREHALDAAAAAGLRCTVRQDWWSVADPTGATTDLSFPHGRTVEQQAALLLLAALTRRDDPMAGFGPHWAADALATELNKRPWWARAHQERANLTDLVTAATQHLVSVALCTAGTPPGMGWQPTPAIHLVHVTAIDAPRTTSPANEEAHHDRN